MVKLAVTFLFTAALAIATVRAQEAGAETVEEVLSRDVSSAESDLFGRAAAKVMNDLFSREELTEVYGRDFDGDLTWRDVTELMEREAIDMSEIEELAARAGAPQEAPEEEAEPKPKHTPKPKSHNSPAHPDKPKGHSVFGQVLDFFNNLIHPKHKAGDKKPETGKKAAPKNAPKAKKAPAKEEAPADEGAEEARDFLDSYFEEPVERSFGEDELDLVERDFLSDDEALEVRELLDTAELELEVRELLDDAALELEVRELLDAAELELAERDFEDADLMEARELLEEYSDVLERDFDEDVFERDVEDDLLEREFEEDVFEREVGDDFDDELLRRAFEIAEELEMLD